LKSCSETNTGAILAYETEDDFLNNWYITICPAFYNPSYLVPLDDLIESMKEEFVDLNVMKNWDTGPGSQAAIFFHETMHLSQIVTSPQATDKTYGAKNVYELARNRNTDAAVYNGDLWTMAATAIFAQQTFKLDNPPYPAAYPPPGAAVGQVKKGSTLPLNIQIVNATGFVPEGAGTPEQDQPFKVDTNLWEIYQPKFSGGKPPICKDPIQMNDCVNKKDKCFCKPKSCMLGMDCYTLEAKNCDANCKGCQYPMSGSC
jgi:hypothetical protein